MRLGRDNGCHGPVSIQGESFAIPRNDIMYADASTYTRYVAGVLATLIITDASGNCRKLFQGRIVWTVGAEGDVE
jgi:hypothetical protein